MLLRIVLCVGMVSLMPSGTGLRAQAPDSLDDGPHVFWTETGPAILSLCADTVAVTRPDPRDTLMVTPACGDVAGPLRIPAAPRPPAGDDWAGVPRVLVVSDIHGEYEALTAFLRGAGVVDAALRWTWGDGHLVILGDIVDRGDRITECLWLLYRLEQEADRAGGRVHVVLGNHEMMVMRDDLRYVHPRYLEGIVRRSRIRYPDLFGPDSEIGRWLRTKPLVLRLNDILFVHGGISPDLVARGLDRAAINRVGRASLDLTSSALAFSDVPRLLYGTLGPLWYRGYHYALERSYPAATSAELDTILAAFGVRAIVVGHTEDDEVRALHGGRVYAVDMPIEGPGSLQGLRLQDGVFARVRGDGTVEPIR